MQDVPIRDPIERRQALLVQVILLGLGGILLFSALLTLAALPFTSGPEAAANLRNSINNGIGVLCVMVPFILLRRGWFRVAVVILMIELFLLAFSTVSAMGPEAGWLGALEFALPISLAALVLGRRWLLVIYIASVAGVATTAFAHYPLSGLSQNAPSVTIAFALIAGLLALFLDRFGTAFRESLAALRTAHTELEQRVIERTSELMHSNQALEQASLTKDRFLANMSHELRTPLNAIIGFTGTLLMRLPGPLTPDQEKQLRTIQRNSQHLLALINDILDLAKIQSGNVTLKREPIVCQEVIEEVAASLHTLAQQKGLELAIVVPAEPIVMHTDRRALTQIVINLLNNAIKFTHRGGVRVALSQHTNQSQGFVEISVADTGIGIAQADQAHLFELFTQVDTTRTRQYEGTGLGLHLSQKLAELLGGQITVQSEPDQGSTFTVRLPEA
ncbi:MAG TPA: ATP-binding protein [Roseiflexaceae bacterium]|nr:ATP-binding protein [Roseiflexaceae bacterium]